MDKKKGAVPMKRLARDNGSYSQKIESLEGSGSHLSVAAPVDGEVLAGFRGARLSDPNSHDISLLEVGENGEVSRHYRRWVVGEAAYSHSNKLFTTRDLDRSSQPAEPAHMCASLKTAFPSSAKGDALSILEERRWVLDRRTFTPVYPVLSIAPGRYKYAEAMRSRALGRYVFIDNVSGQLYAFEVRDAEVVPESFGSLYQKLACWEGKRVVNTKERARLESIRVGIWDLGGQTFDYMAYERRVLVGALTGTEEVGLFKYVDDIITAVYNGQGDQLATKPSRETILRAIEGIRPGDKVSIRGRNGYPVDISHSVHHHLSLFGSAGKRVYDDVFEGGGAIDALLLTGGVSPVIYPYLKEFGIEHRRTNFAMRKGQVWRANSIGALLYGYREREEDAL